MNNIPEVINNTLEVLSSKFGTSVDQLWQTMVQQQVYEGWAHLTIGCFLLGMVVGIGFLIRYFDKQGDGDEVIVSSLIGGFILIFGLIFFYEAYMELINPQYQAIKEFLEVFKGE